VSPVGNVNTLCQRFYEGHSSSFKDNVDVVGKVKLKICNSAQFEVVRGSFEGGARTWSKPQLTQRSVHEGVSTDRRPRSCMPVDDLP